MSSAKWRLFPLGLNELSDIQLYVHRLSGNRDYHYKDKGNPYFGDMGSQYYRSHTHLGLHPFLNTAYNGRFSVLIGMMEPGLKQV